MLFSKILLSSLAATASLPLVLVIHGTDDSDILDGTEASEIFICRDGTFDQARGGGGDDMFFGGKGVDFLFAEDGCDLMFGGDGDDNLRPTTGDDLMFGGRGDDTLDHYGELIFAPVPCFTALDEFDVSYGGPGDDVVRWASGPVNGPAGFPFQPCVTSGNGYSDGGPGIDTVFVGVGDFAASSSDYVIEAGPWWGGQYQLRSLVTGAVLNLRRYERVEFSDVTITL